MKCPPVMTQKPTENTVKTVTEDQVRPIVQEQLALGIKDAVKLFGEQILSLTRQQFSLLSEEKDASAVPVYQRGRIGHSVDGP